MYDLITVGPAGIDTFVELAKARVSKTKQGDPELTLPFGDKLISPVIEPKTAYNGMNNAIGGGRLKLNTAIYCCVGGGANGKRIVDNLKRDNVDTRYVKVEKKLRSNASVVLNYKGERTILVHHEEYTYRLPKFAPTKWFYLTSLGKNWAPLYDKFTAHIERTGENVGFNPGSFQLKAGASKLRRVLNVTTALFLNKEEAQRLTKRPKEKSEKKLLIAMRKLGPPIAVLTDGPNGSYTYDGKKFRYLKIFPTTKIIDRTGCGDCYATSTIAAFINGHDIVEAMRWGTINAAGKVQMLGPQDGLRTLTELKKLLKANPKFQPKEI